MKKIIFMLFFVFAVTSYAQVAPTSLALTEQNPKSEVSRDRLLYRILGNAKQLSVSELLEVYKKDIGTAAPDYLTNLKNMWFTLLNPRVYQEGTDQQKLYCITEQLALDNNLAHFTGFYNLLAALKKMGRIEKERIANAYYNKNLHAIAEVQWGIPTDRKKKEMELVYAKRTFQNLLNTQR